jgi:mannitol/fructose-specific phosphotransferase system IIA component (Ntr-type)
MIYIEDDKSDLFVLSQKVLAQLLREMGEIPSKVRVLMFVAPDYEWNGHQKQILKHLREIISDDRRLSRLLGVDIKVTIKETKQFTKPNVIGLVFQFS